MPPSIESSVRLAAAARADDGDEFAGGDLRATSA